MGLKEVYGAEFKEFKALDAGGPLTIGALEGGDIQVANLFSTDVSIGNKGWVVLEEDKPSSPRSTWCPSAQGAMTDRSRRRSTPPTKLTTEELTKLDKVDNDKEDPDSVAEAWLKEQGLTS